MSLQLASACSNIYIYILIKHLDVHDLLTMNLIHLCVWRTLGCVNFSAQNHLAKMLVPIIINNSHTFAWSAGWSVPSSNHDPQVNIRVPTEACVPTYFRLGEADTEASLPEGNLLLNWVIHSTLPPNYISAFEVGFFLPSHICSVGVWTGFHWLPRCGPDWMGMMYLRGRVGLYAAYQTGTQNALESHG